jgi:hypothetical protein
VAASDGGYSDEDGSYPTTCGLLVVDNVNVGADVSNFEAGANGWVQEVPTTGVGDFSNISLLGDLEPPAVFCPCGLADSVLVFFDLNDGHPLDQDNIVMSPWIDLLAGGDAGRPGKLMLYDVVRAHAACQLHLRAAACRYYPETCAATGLIYRTPWKGPEHHLLLR